MNDKLENCLYKSGLTAQGCWDELDDYAKQGIEKFAELIVLECCKEARDEVQSITNWDKADQVVARIKEHFGVTE